MTILSAETIAHFIHAYGLFAVFGIVMMESAGIPMPGETALITASIYAGSTHQLNIVSVISAAAAAAIVGDNIGFWVGREFGFPLLLKYGRYIRIDEKRLKLGQYLFRQHGGKIVFFGRFVAVLRAFAAILAGANRLPWPRFLLYNAAGGIAWATLFGSAGYIFGSSVHRITGPFGASALIAGLVSIGAALVFYKRHEAMLQAAAEQAIPGPLTAA